MTDKFKPGDVTIKALTIITHAGTVISLEDMYTEFSVFEDVFSPFVTASIAVIDGNNILKDGPLLGGEVVNVEFETPSRNIAKYKFIVKSIDNVDPVPPMNTSYSYTLNCISEEAFINNTKLISKTYTGSMSDIVANVLKKDLETKKPLFFDTTKGVQDFIINYERPFDAIRKASKRAVSLQDKSSSYFFFENKEGFHFMTLETLADTNKSKIGDKIFINVPVSSAKEANNPDEYRQLLGMAVSDTPNLVDDIESGVFNSKTITFDLITKTTKTTSFNLSEQISEFKGFSDKKENIRIPKNVVKKYSGGSAKVYYRVADSSNKDTYIDEMLAKKVAYTMLLLKSPMLLNSHGDSSLKVGDVVTVKYPKTSGINGDTAKEEKNTSGNHLVIRLRHAIRKTAGGAKYVNAMETVSFFGGNK